MLLTGKEVCSKRINSANWSSTEWVRVAVKRRSCSVGGIRDAVITTVKNKSSSAIGDGGLLTTEAAAGGIQGKLI